MITILFTTIFCLSLAAGWALAFYNGSDLLGYAMSIIIGGFAGSSIIALVFSWLYFFQKETDSEKIQRLREEINRIKGVKKLK